MPIGSTDQPLRHGFLVPPLGEAKVVDIMRTGVFICPRDAHLAQVARMMDSYRVHAIVVSDLGDAGGGWGLVSDLDLVASVGAPGGTVAADVARTEVITITPDEPVERAAQLMTEHETAHLLVVEREAGRPLGVVSTLDVAAVLARGGAA